MEGGTYYSITKLSNEQTASRGCWFGVGISNYREVGSRVSWDGRTKEIIHFLPSPEAPQELLELEEVIVKNAYPSDRP